MEKFLIEAAKMLLAVMLGLVYIWFILSFKWSFDDMSTAEKIIGIVYAFVMIPLYEGIKYVGRKLMGR